jgi:putative sugar O-methyltransferase
MTTATVSNDVSTVQDNLSLLEEMMVDFRSQISQFPEGDPTIKFIDEFYTDLRDKGLKKMVKEGSILLNTIGACNYSPLQQMGYNLKKRLDGGEITKKEYDVLIESSRIIFEKGNTNLMPYELSMEDLNQAAFRACELYALSVGAKPPGELSMSEAFYPEYTFTVNGNKYSYLFLYYYCRYVFCSQFFDFDKITNVVELGSGSGRAVEIIKKLHPHISFHMIDLAPQLYTSYQFLSALFPEEIVDYNHTRNAEAVKSLKSGGIHFYPFYKFDKFDLKGGMNLSWNTMVFCILTPEKALDYLNKIKSFADYIFIVEPTTEAGGAQYGLSEPVTYKHYEKFLSDNTYKLIKRSPAFRPLAAIRAWGGVEDLLWSKV